MKQNKNETKNTRFFYQLKAYGLKNFFVSVDFIIALVVLIFIFIDQGLNLGIFSKINNDYIVAIFAVSATLFAITLTALAILLSFSNTGFVEFLRKHDKFSKFLFIFWSGSAAYLLAITFSIVYFLFISGCFENFVRNVIYPIVVSLFIYAIINTFYLLGAIIRFGYFLDIFDRLRDNEPKK
jgi:hypothetical protein